VDKLKRLQISEYEFNISNEPEIEDILNFIHKAFQENKVLKIKLSIEHLEEIK